VKSSKTENTDARPAASASGQGDKLAESFRSVFELALESRGTERTAQMLEQLARELRTAPRPTGGQTTPYLNTIPVEDQPEYPGDRAVERRIKSIMRWNAMAMVVKANSTTNVGGHIASFASSATL
jgi:pyruvate dehydrogenase E1 component